MSSESAYRSASTTTSLEYDYRTGRRERNRLAARKCRAKKDDEMRTLEQRVSELVRVNEELKDDVMSLLNWRDQILAEITGDTMSCIPPNRMLPIDPPTPYGTHLLLHVHEPTHHHHHHQHHREILLDAVNNSRHVKNPYPPPPHLSQYPVNQSHYPHLPSPALTLKTNRESSIVAMDVRSGAGAGLAVPMQKFAISQSESGISVSASKRTAVKSMMETVEDSHVT